MCSRKTEVEWRTRIHAGENITFLQSRTLSKRKEKKNGFESGKRRRGGKNIMLFCLKKKQQVKKEKKGNLAKTNFSEDRQKNWFIFKDKIKKTLFVTYQSWIRGIKKNKQWVEKRKYRGKGNNTRGLVWKSKSKMRNAKKRKNVFWKMTDWNIVILQTVTENRSVSVSLLDSPTGECVRAPTDFHWCPCCRSPACQSGL